MIILSDNKRKDIISDLYSAELPYLAVTNQIHIELYSNKRLILDGSFSVMEYTNELICLKLKKGTLHILGRELTINSVSQDHIFMTGEIINLQFEG